MTEKLGLRATAKELDISHRFSYQGTTRQKREVQEMKTSNKPDSMVELFIQRSAIQHAAKQPSGAKPWREVMADIEKRARPTMDAQNTSKEVIARIESDEGAFGRPAREPRSPGRARPWAEVLASLGYAKRVAR
jgi:hypothetical protein